MQKGVDDPYGRGTLFQHIMRVCAVKKPRYILMENVKGLLSKKFDETRAQMCKMLREMGYVANPNDPDESPLAMAVLNSKDYGIPQNRERVWMFARLGGLPKGFTMVPPERKNNLKMADFLDPEGYVPKELYLSTKQIEHLKARGDDVEKALKLNANFNEQNKEKATMIIINDNDVASLEKQIDLIFNK